MPYTFISGGLSDKGLIRENNEDAWGEIEACNFYTLADGMGGHQAGEVAAREAVSHLLRLVRKCFKSLKPKSLPELAKEIKQAMIRVNTIVHTLGKSAPDLRGMGTTLCAILFQEGGAIIAHVGDSRIYRVRDGHLEQMTKDHSLFSELVELGQLSEHISSEFAYKNIITKAIGTEPSVEPEVVIEDLHPEDTYLLCTDGLSDLIKPEEMISILTQDKSPQEMAQAFVKLANERGGHDNITAIIIKAHEI
ncbi:MAG: Stp1/IreP family PP2C-type Ser/Thr phosphatase [Chlamydiia bacterium]|nr:Stp1/IreP family PP2C-type Ser/Thr phosphatase [Chlamydiia bacterium]